MAGHSVCWRTARQAHCADRVSEAKRREGDAGAISASVPPSSTRIPLNLVDGGQFGNIPAATQGFHKENARSHAARKEIYGSSLICQGHALCRDYGQIVVETALIAIDRLVERAQRIRPVNPPFPVKNLE
jgi:hypothetical protein